MTDNRLLTLSDCSSWYGLAQALFDVDINVGKGEIVGLLGRNGAGKTTTFRSIMKSLVRTQSVATFNGESLDGLTTDRIARLGISWVPEDRRVFPTITVEDNLVLAAKSSGKKTYPRDLILDALPILEPLMQRMGAHLSGGEQQAVAIARGLASTPSLMLLDEPTEGLAPVIVEFLEAAISRLPSEFGVSVLMAEQNLPFVLRLSSRVYVLEVGRLVHEASTAGFAADKETQDRYLSFSGKH